MKKPDLIKQLANRINQPHVIESWINKIEKAAYKKGYADAQNEQCNIPDVSQRSELLPEFLMKDCDGKIVIAYIGGADVTKEWNEFLAANCT